MCCGCVLGIGFHVLEYSLVEFFELFHGHFSFCDVLADAGSYLAFDVFACGGLGLPVFEHERLECG